jgi:hypothetical protein
VNVSVHHINLSLSLNNSNDVIVYDQSTDVKGEEGVRTLPINLVIQAAQKSNKRVHIIQGKKKEISTKNILLINFRRFGCS